MTPISSMIAVALVAGFLAGCATTSPSTTDSDGKARLEKQRAAVRYITTFGYPRITPSGD